MPGTALELKGPLRAPIVENPCDAPARVSSYRLFWARSCPPPSPLLHMLPAGAARPRILRIFLHNASFCIRKERGRLRCLDAGYWIWICRSMICISDIGRVCTAVQVSRCACVYLYTIWRDCRSMYVWIYAGHEGRTLLSAVSWHGHDTVVTLS